MNSGSFSSRITHLSRRLFVNPVNNRTRKIIIEKFSEKYGLKYKGYVNQHTDQDSVIRGFSVSASHEDNHYTFGVINNRNVALVDRVDAIWKDDGQTIKHNWLIMSFRLKTSRDVPHIFIQANNHESDAYHTFFTSFSAMGIVELGTLENYDHEFTSRFKVYAKSTHHIEVQKLLPNKITRVIAAHFWPLSVEVCDGYVYLYADNKQVTQNLLDSMVKCGVWLADHLDKQVEVI